LSCDEGTQVRTAYFELDDKTEELRHELGLRKDVARDFEERFEVSWIFHENALEGTVIDVFDLKAALDHVTIGDGVLIPTYQRIRNHRLVIEKIRQMADEPGKSVTLQFVKGLHLLLCHGIQGSGAGLYRKEIPIHRTYFHDIVEPGKISYQMNKLVRDLKGREFKQLHPIQQAAEVHFRFMATFPFDQETGKVARLLMNLFVLRANYFPVIIPDVERQHYYEALRASPSELHALIVYCMEQQLERSLRFLRNETLTPPP